MRRTTGPVKVGATGISTNGPPILTPGLQLPLEYIADRLQLSVSALLNLDQNVVECAFPQLLERLQLRHARELVSQRVEERHDARMAAKVGTVPTGPPAGVQQAAEETAYRAVFTNLILQQALALGFKGVINPNLTSIVKDKKLALRIIDFLAKKVST
jgi:AraC-like DNA-binding protein